MPITDFLFMSNQSVANPQLPTLIPIFLLSFNLGAYPSQSVCEYRITGRQNSMLNITFNDLNLPWNSNCSETDHIIISSILGRNNLYSNGDQYDDVTILCGSEKPSPILTDGNEVLIKFVTKDSNSRYRGFSLFFNSTKEECGGDIQADNGIIESPGYPVGRDLHRYCEWLVTVPKGRRVRVDIMDYDVRGRYQFMRPSFRRPMSRLGFYYNRFLHNSIRVYLRGSAGALDPVYSTDNKMFITLFLSENVGHRGLKLNFSSNEASPCTGDFNGGEGSFSTPTNITSFYCEYTRSDAKPYVINDPGRGTLGIKVSDLSEYQRGCESNDFHSLGLTVIYYIDLYERMLFRVCNQNRTDQYVATPFADTKLVTKQILGSLVERKFQFQYKVHNCGGVFSSILPTNISKPNFGGNYGSLDCAWQFKSDDRQIQIMLTSSGLSCDTEYIKIYNGLTPSGPKVAKICGENNSNRLFTLMPSLFIEYHADSYQSKSTFNIQISTNDGICGGEMQSPHHYFSSPRNGTVYPNNAECVWDLKARAGFHIGLQFVTRFFIENSLNCTKDYVDVLDKVNDNYLPLGRFCGRDIPQYVNSTGSEMRVILRTDGDIAGDGFSALWSENCGGIFKATNEVQFIESPGYPDKYLGNLNCNYTIITDGDGQINVNFVDFELETMSMSCEYDNVTIYKPQSYSFPPTMEEIGTYCREGSISKFRSSSKIEVAFRTDRWIEKRGFKFEYHLDKCGGNINDSTTIRSLNNDKDNTYETDARCLWNITAPADKKIVIRFEEIDLEHNDACYMDYVDVFQGHSTEAANRKAKLCGNMTENPPVVSIPSNKAIVQFRTDSSINQKGFVALVLFVSNCDLFIHLNSSSPSYTLDRLSVVYDDLLDCHYEVIAPDGYVISLSFERFHLMPCGGSNSTSCTCDFVEIRDGPGPFSELVGSYCGHQSPAPFTSNRNKLWIRFATGKGVGNTIKVSYTLTHTHRSIPI